MMISEQSKKYGKGRLPVLRIGGNEASSEGTSMLPMVVDYGLYTLFQNSNA